MLMENCSLVEVFPESSRTHEVLLSIAPQKLWDAYWSVQINDLAIIRAKESIADDLINVKSHCSLIDALDLKKLHQPVKQWTVREH